MTGPILEIHPPDVITLEFSQQGIQGTPGADGNAILSGNGVPSNGLGVAGNFYIDMDDWILYGPKTVVWPSGTSIIGPQGIDGRTILNGAGTPTAGDGVNGDFWIRTGTWDIYGPKTAGAWGSPTSLRGVGEEFLIAFTLGDGVNVISTGLKIRVPIPKCDFSAVQLIADAAGNIVLDFWVDTYGNIPPTVVDTITASAKPTLSSAIKSEDITLTGWIKSFAAARWMYVNVDSASVVKQVTVLIKAVKTG